MPRQRHSGVRRGKNPDARRLRPATGSGRPRKTEANFTRRARLAAYAGEPGHTFPFRRSGSYCRRACGTAGRIDQERLSTLEAVSVLM